MSRSKVEFFVALSSGEVGGMMTVASEGDGSLPFWSWSRSCMRELEMEAVGLLVLGAMGFFK